MSLKQIVGPVLYFVIAERVGQNIVLFAEIERMGTLNPVL